MNLVTQFYLKGIRDSIFLIDRALAKGLSHEDAIDCLKKSHEKTIRDFYRIRQGVEK